MVAFHRLSPAALALVLCACGDSSDSNDIIEPQPTEVPDINQAKAFAGGLEQAGAANVERFLKNGIYAATVDQVRLVDFAEPVAEDAAASSGSDFSTTNTQEQGVDEADRIEYDGNYMYIATYPVWTETGVQDAAVRILKRNEDFSLTEVNRLPVDTDGANVQGLYLHDDRLAVLSSNFQIFPMAQSFIEPWIPYNPKVALSIYDTASPAETSVITDIEIDGWLLSSRRINDELYLVTSFVPAIESLEIAPEDEQTQLQNYLTILDTPTEELMPQLNVDGSSQPLNAVEDCYIPEQAEENDGYAQLVTVTRINMATPSDVTSSCMSLFADIMYMSQQNIYLASTFEQNATVVHKIALDETLSYQASGSVEGIISWSNLPNLRLSEEQGYLRIVSSNYDNWQDPEHYLSILVQNGNALDVVAVLPNEQQPEPLGKEGEDIYAVRFFGDKGYIVTFERVDPLYVLDLADPLNPMVAGSLEIPGFSSYLHPIENNYVLGVGQDVTIGTNTENGQDLDEIEEPPLITNGVKVSLFDVQDPSNPQELGSIVKEDAYTPVEYDYRALSVLQQGNTYKFAMPTERWQFVDGGEAFVFYESINSLLMLEVDTALGELTEVSELAPNIESDVYVFGGEDRSVLHEGQVYYLRGNQVWHGVWQTSLEANGPY